MTNNLTFWDHLEELRRCLIRIIGATIVCSIVAFFFREQIFSFLLAPRSADFVTFRFLSRWFDVGDISAVTLINTGIANQFLVHLRVSVCVGLICVSPYILYVLFGFISPALYRQERSAALRATLSGYLLFMLGLAVNYLVIFPFSVIFLGTYQVDSSVTNMIDLE